MAVQLVREVKNFKLFEPQVQEHLFIESDGSQRVKVNAIQDGLQGVLWAVFALHRIGKNKLPALGEHAVDLFEHFRPVPTVQNGIL